MLERAVLADLHARSGEIAVIASRTLRCWGDSESGLNEKLDGVIAELDAPGNPTLAFLASGWDGLKIRLTAKAGTIDAADVLLDSWSQRIAGIVGDNLFSAADESMEAVVLKLLGQRGWTLGLAESVTGGLIAARLTGVPGASEVLRGSIVSYASEVKFDLLGVRVGPVVSADAAVAMAEGARRVLGADVGLAVTGVAGPTEQDGMAVGTLFVGFAIGDAVGVVQVQLPGQREQMRQMAVITALDALRRNLLAANG